MKNAWDWRQAAATKASYLTFNFCSCEMEIKIILEKKYIGISLAVRWLELHLPVQWVQV